jgi:hypothetical protein
MTKIESLSDVQPGDIFFGPIGGAVGIGVGIGQAMLGEGWSVGPLKIRHVGIVVEAGERLPVSQLENGPLLDYDGTSAISPPRMVQAMPRGAEEIAMTPDRHWTEKCAYVRLVEDYPGQAADAAAIARLMVSEGVAYSFASYGALALWRWGLETPRLESWINRRGRTIDMPTRLPVLAARNEPVEIRLPREAICSVLVDQAWTLAGKSVMIGTPKQCVTPGRLAGRLLFETAGAQWSFPRRTSPVL